MEIFSNEKISNTLHFVTEEEKLHNDFRIFFFVVVKPKLFPKFVVVVYTKLEITLLNFPITIKSCKRLII